MLGAMKIVINDFGKKGDCGKCLIQRENTVLAQLLPAMLAQHWRFIALMKNRETLCA